MRTRRCVCCVNILIAPMHHQISCVPVRRLPASSQALLETLANSISNQIFQVQEFVLYAPCAS